MSEDSLFSLATLSGAYHTGDSAYRYAKLPMDGLVPDRRYFYRVIVNDIATDPVRRFSAFPAGAKSYDMRYASGYPFIMLCSRSWIRGGLQ